MKASHMLLLAPALMALMAFASDRPNKASDNIYQLSWLSGQWAGQIAGNRFEAIYTDARGGAVLSTNKEFLPDGTCYIEFEHFHVKDSVIVLTPYPGGSKSVDFTLINFDPAVKKAHFQNQAHDFPTDIIYEITENGHLHIEVSGPAGDSTRSFTVELEPTD